MKQEPTGAAHAAGGIPVLQGREDVNSYSGQLAAVPVQQLTAIAHLPETRLRATIGSEADLIAQVRLHRFEAWDNFEEPPVTEFSGTRVPDRWITPRSAERPPPPSRRSVDRLRAVLLRASAVSSLTVPSCASRALPACARVGKRLA